MSGSGRAVRSLLAVGFDSRVTVHQLRIFKLVAAHRNFSRAAEALYLSQPAVSHQIKALSAAVAVPLFEEIARRIHLTSAGTLLYEHASRIIADFEMAGRALDELHGLRRGLLRLAGDTTVGIYVLPDVLGTFREAHPDVDVSLDVGNRQHVYDRLIANEADFAVVGRLWPRPAIPLTTRPFLPNELIAIAAARHPLAGMKRISIARLAGEPFITREPGSGTRETAEVALRRAGRPVRTVMELASNGAIKRAVARGLGVAILSRPAVTMEIRRALRPDPPVAGFPLRGQWHMVYARDKRFGPVERAFLSFIDDGEWRSHLGELPLTECWD